MDFFCTAAEFAPGLIAGKEKGRERKTPCTTRPRPQAMHGWAIAGAAIRAALGGDGGGEATRNGAGAFTRQVYTRTGKSDCKYLLSW